MISERYARMPAVTDGLVQINLLTVFNNTEALNVFYYWNQTNTQVLDLTGVVQAFDTEIFPELADILGTTTAIVRLTGKDVFGLTPDAIVTPSTGSGNVVGEQAANFTAVRINLLPTTKETGRGYKRFGGITETSLAGNGLTSGFIVDLQDLGTKLNNPLTVGAATYVPVIYGKPTPTDPTRQVVNPILTTTVPNEQKTQGTRKR